MEGKSNIDKKLPKNVNKFENSQFFQYLGLSEETFDHKLDILLVTLSRAFLSFYFTGKFQSQIRND